MYQHLPLDKKLNEKKGFADDRKRKSFEGEYKKIESLCKEFGVPDPDELYIVARDFENLKNPNLTQFDTTMPEGLARWIDEAEFEYTLSRINDFLLQAEKIDCRTVWNGICKYLTCFMIKACQRTRMERAIIKIRNFILSQNQEVYHPKGFHIVEPGARGMRHIEFRSITYYSIKYFLEHEDEIPVTAAEQAYHKAQKKPSTKRSISSLNEVRRSLAELKHGIK